MLRFHCTSDRAKEEISISELLFSIRWGMPFQFQCLWASLFATPFSLQLVGSHSVSAQGTATDRSCYASSSSLYLKMDLCSCITLRIRSAGLETWLQMYAKIKNRGGMNNGHSVSNCLLPGTWWVCKFAGLHNSAGWFNPVWRLEHSAAPPPLNGQKKLLRKSMIPATAHLNILRTDNVNADNK